MTYDWQALLVFVATLLVVSSLGRFLVFKVPDLDRARRMNRETDRVKLSRKPFKAAVKINNKAGLMTNVVFFALVMPFYISLDTRPIWRHVFDVLAVLLIFDFFYYLTHRFLFHGTLLRKVHALHHQARTPTYIDALYVHPIETVIGLVLFLFSIPLVAMVGGAPLSVFSVAAATLLFTYINQINHTWVELPRFPFKTITSMRALHAAHHVDMNQGNYATLTMLYDWLFGTLEAPVHRATP